MSTCLAIIAHDRAGPTVTAFLPQWRKLGVPIIGFMPMHQEWPGEPIDRVYHYGVSAHKGVAVFDRFLNVCETLMRTEHDRFVIAEYDTLNLTANLPRFGAGLWSAFCTTYGPNVTKATGLDRYYLSLSPWCIERESMPAFINAMRARLAEPFASEWVNGLLDRWLATVIFQANLPREPIKEACGWAYEVPGVHDAIRKHALTWVHGWKTKEEFADLWPA